LAALWLVVCGYCSLAGWALSALGVLNAAGYVVVLGAGLVVLWLAGGKTLWELRQGLVWSRLRRRFSRPLPLLFLAYLLMALAGGALYAPTNYDALTYRVPRMLHWLAEGHWHWIESNDNRVNISATGIEWLMAPLFALTRTDRLLFLINLVSYLLLPGLFYGTLTRLGVARRLAWYWMWILPAGYCFAVQAGSVGNDTLGAVFLLAALHFNLSAWRSGHAQDLWLGTLAAMLLSGSKASNLPLLLPWVITAFAALKTVRLRPVLAAALALTLVASFLPTAILNTVYTRDWAGDPTNEGKMKLESPVSGVIGNGLQLLSANTMPPLVPFASAWNQRLAEWRKTPAFQKLQADFPRMTVNWQELPQEEGAGVGLGVCALLAGSVVWGFFRFGRAGAKPSAERTLGWAIGAGGWVALLAYMAKMGSEAAPRLVAGYYPVLMLPFLLVPGQALLVRLRSWRRLAWLAAAMTLPAVILETNRPLWPARAICGALLEKYPDSQLLRRANLIYNTYSLRADSLGVLRQYIPPHVKEIGFIGRDDPETSLWRPWGEHRFFCVTPWNQNQVLGTRIQVLVVNAGVVDAAFNVPFDQWLADRNLRILGHEEIITKASSGLQQWYVLGTSSAGQSASNSPSSPPGPAKTAP
jgi:hypothetical protein